MTVISSKKIYRRIKDLYDLCVLITTNNFMYCNVLRHLSMKHPNVELSNYLVPEYYNDIMHAYDKFQGIVNKPSIQQLVAISSTFLEPFYNKVSVEMEWRCDKLCWMVV